MPKKPKKVARKVKRVVKRKVTPKVKPKRKRKMVKKYDKESGSLVVDKEEKEEKPTKKPADPNRKKLEALLKAIQDCKDLPGSDFDLRDIEAAIVKRLESEEAA